MNIVHDDGCTAAIIRYQLLSKGRIVDALGERRDAFAIARSATDGPVPVDLRVTRPVHLQVLSEHARSSSFNLQGIDQRTQGIAELEHERLPRTGFEQDRFRALSLPNRLAKCGNEQAQDQKDPGAEQMCA